MDFEKEMAEFGSKCNDWVGSSNEKGIMILACEASGEQVRHCVCMAGKQSLVSYTSSKILNGELKVNGLERELFVLEFSAALMYIAKEGTDESFVELFDMELMKALINRTENIFQKQKSDETESDG